MQEWFQIFLETTEKQVEAIRENTQALQDIKMETKLQTMALQANQKTLDEVKNNLNSFNEGLKEDITEKFKTAESKMDSLDKDMKIQWAILGGGFFTVVATIIIAIIQAT